MAMEQKSNKTELPNPSTASSMFFPCKRAHDLNRLCYTALAQDVPAVLGMSAMCLDRLRVTNRYWRECDLMVFLFGICMFWRHVCSTAYTQLPGTCISVGNQLYLVPGTKYMTRYWLNMTKYCLNMYQMTIHFENVQERRFLRIKKQPQHRGLGDYSNRLPQ